jgi:hypothetical protein
MITFLKNLALFLSQKAPFFSPIYLALIILKIKTPLF